MNQKTDDFDFELFFNALADRTRLRIINLMGDDEVCVCFFVEVLGTNQPKISRHLAYLKKAGLVTTRREGNWIHYRVAEPTIAGAARILHDVRAFLETDAEMQADKNRLVGLCCAAELPASVQDAPLPKSLINYRCG